MSNKVLMKGNEAIAEAAIRSGCKHFFGYPITPQTELSAYMAKKMPKIGGVFLQAESEVAAINMVYGAGGAGARAMTSSSSPGISLKSEGISYIAGADVPCVIVDIVRGGPGLGGIQPAQSDYFQVTKGGGHGDYHLIVLAPNSVQEIVSLTADAFNLSDKYRVPAMILGDGTLGQMMEPVDFDNIPEPIHYDKSTWATDGTEGKRKHNIINSLYLAPEELEDKIRERFERYKVIEETEQRYETHDIEDADIVISSYGTTSRVVESAVTTLRSQGYKVGVIRPITLWPFPTKAYDQAKNAKAFLSVEMSMGQMVEDVKLAVGARAPVYFFGRTGGIIPTPLEVIDEVKKVAEEIK